MTNWRLCGAIPRKCSQTDNNNWHHSLTRDMLCDISLFTEKTWLKLVFLCFEISFFLHLADAFLPKTVKKYKMMNLLASHSQTWNLQLWYMYYYATGRLALNVEQDLSFWIEKESSTIKAKVFHRKNFSEIKFCHSFEDPSPKLTDKIQFLPYQS